MTSLLEWMLVIGLSFIAFGLLAGSSLAVQRRRHFWRRVALLCLAMAAAELVLFIAMENRMLSEHVLMGFWLTLVLGALIVAPVCCYRGERSTPGPGDDGDGGAGRPVSSPPTRPRGGIPLLDGEMSNTRMRDHTRPKLDHASPRRTAREPARVPARRRSLARS